MNAPIQQTNAINIGEILANAYMLVQYRTSFAKVSATDKDATDDVIAQKGAQKGAGRVIKNLWHNADAEVKAVKSAIDAGRQWHYKLTAPYSAHDDGSGPRLLANECMIEPGTGYLARMAECKREMIAALHALEQVYDLRVQEAIHNLGGLAKASDYPTWEEFKSGCSIAFDFTPVPVASAWAKSSVGATIANQLSERTEKSTRMAAANAIKDAVTRVVEPLDRMIAQTAPLGPNEKARKIYDTLVTNLETMVSTLKQFNIFNDPAIDAVRARIEAELLRYSPEQIRNSENAKVQLHGAAKAVRQDVQAILDRGASFGFL